MTNYQKTKIYKIESHVGDKVYIGSTAKEYLSQRFQQHKNAYKQWKKGMGGKVSSYELFEEYGPENCQIILIESFPCNNKDEKNKRECHFIKEFNCVNKVIITRTKQQYYQDNKDIIAEQRKDYYHDNKDNIIEHMKEYYQDNKDKIIEHRKQIFDCECGCKITITCKARHNRSKKHMDRLKLDKQNKSEPIII